MAVTVCPAANTLSRRLESKDAGCPTRPMVRVRLVKSFVPSGTPLVEELLEDRRRKAVGG